MNSRKIEFVNGQFYDLETRKRVTFGNGCKLEIKVREEDFTLGEDAGHIVKPKSRKAIEAKITSKFRKAGRGWYKRLLERGEYVYFRIALEVKQSYWKGEFIFKVRLDEDLYAYKLEGGKKDDIRLFDCACVMEEVISGTIEYFTKVHGKSLNEVYKTTYVHYFANYGSPAANAHDRFFTDPGLKEGTEVRNLYLDEKGGVGYAKID